MANKIEGWVDQFMVPPHRREHNEDITVQDHKWLSGDLRCTLVISDERVFTESEVRAILNTFMNHLRDGCSVMSGDVRAVARYHGIVLDPA